MLGCSAVTSEECLGYEGDCSLLPTQFSESNGFQIPDDYTCHQFPDGAWFRQQHSPFPVARFAHAT